MQNYLEHKIREINMVIFIEWFNLLQAKSNMMFCSMTAISSTPKGPCSVDLLEPTYTILFHQNKLIFYLIKCLQNTFFNQP